MANSLSGSFPAYWSKRMQIKHEKTDVFRAIANFEERATLKNGDTAHRPYRSAVVAQVYTRGTAVTIQDLTNTDESLVVQTARVVPFYVDDLDALQDNYSTINLYADDAAVQLGNLIDASVLGEYGSATSTVDDGTLGGTTGNGITLSTTNVLKVFTKAGRKLDALNIEPSDRFAAISPQFKEVLIEYLAGKESILGDSTGKNGMIGSYYGFDLYLTNNLTGTAVWIPANNPSNNDTITINGVTFTFVSSIGSTAGNVLQTVSLSQTLTNLAALINAPNTTTANGVALSATNGAVFATKYSAVATTTQITVKGKGTSYLTVSGSDATDVWTAATQIQHNLFGRKGATDVVVQQEPKVEIKEVPDKIGKNILPYTLFGFKTFAEGAGMLVDVQIRSDAF